MQMFLTPEENIIEQLHTGVRSGAVQMHLYMTNLLKLAAAHKARKGGK